MWDIETHGPCRIACWPKTKRVSDTSIGGEYASHAPIHAQTAYRALLDFCQTGMGPTTCLEAARHRDYEIFALDAVRLQAGVQ